MARPSLADIERLSRGQSTVKHVGSRSVPHRLNQEERKLFELAMKRGFVVVRGCAHRRERKGSPLLNSLRQRADALSQPLIVVSQPLRRSALPARTVVDLSPLRLTDEELLLAARERCCSVVRAILGKDTGAAIENIPSPLVPATDEEADSLPIWALPPLQLQIVADCRPSEAKLAKRVAAALADAWSSGAPPHRN